jgi:hydrogenase maturation factor
MCLTYAARVVGVSDFELIVEHDGRRETVTDLLVPDARIGDDVLVGMGRALASLSPAEADELRSLHLLISPEPVASAPGPEST